MVGGVWLSSQWHVSCNSEIQATVTRAVRSGTYHQRPVVFVCEDWFGSIKTLKALCEERGKWRYVVERKSHLTAYGVYWVTVNSNTWANSYRLPKTTGPRKQTSIAIANTIIDRRVRTVTSDDEADAVLIANFASKWSGLSRLGLDKVYGKV